MASQIRDCSLHEKQVGICDAELNVQAGDDRQFFQAVYDHLKKQYPHCVSAYCHYDEAERRKVVSE